MRAKWGDLARSSPYLESKGINDEEDISGYPQELVVMKELSDKHEEEKYTLDYNRLMKMKQLFLQYESMCNLMIAYMCNGDENLLLSLVDFKKILVKNLKIAVLYKSRPGDPKVPTAKKDLIITWNSNKLRSNTALEEYLTLCGNIHNTMDIDEDNDDTV